MLMGALFMSMTELGSGDFPGLCACRPTSPGLHAFFN